MSDEKDKKEKNEEKLKLSSKEEDKKLSAHEETPLLQESYIRLMADFDNYKKRMIREKELALEYANEKLVKDLLVLLDDLDHYEKSLKKEEEKRGVELLKGKFLGILSAHGVKVINPLNEKFSPENSEAVQILKTKNKNENNMIVEVISKGYKLKDRFLRYPKVIVYKFDEEK
jgi:molecular chaperone GrpE